MSEREHLCKNCEENNYGEGCKSHGLLKLHCTLFYFFLYPLSMRRLVEIGAFVRF